MSEKGIREKNNAKRTLNEKFCRRKRVKSALKVVPIDYGDWERVFDRDDVVNCVSLFWTPF